MDWLPPLPDLEDAPEVEPDPEPASHSDEDESEHLPAEDPDAASDRPETY